MDGGNTMMKFCDQSKLLSAAILAIAFLVSFGFFTEAKAICNSTACLNGYTSCLLWCENHNKTNHSKGVCSVNCGDYWHDGASLEHGNPSNPSGPPRYVGPGRVKNPPTTVSNPTPPSQGTFKPVDPGSGGRDSSGGGERGK
jgi:hypothetical protein